MVSIKHFFLLVYIFIFLGNLNLLAQDPNLHIYLCFGQSNMEGQGTIENQDRTVDSRFQVMGTVNCTGSRSFTLGQWSAATPPLFRCNTNLGPADYFGRTMVAGLPSIIKIGIVPVAIAGCDIALFDKVNYASYAATAPSWMQNAINQYGGNPYARLVEVAKLAQKDGVIKGILMHQGETNNGQTTWPAKVKAVYDNLIADLSLDPTKTPFLVGEVVTTAQGGQCGAHNSIIATVPNVIPNSYVISASGLPPVSDNLHFTSASYRTLGQRYAQKMLSLLPISNGASPVISLTAPANNATYAVDANISLTANASDSDGSVTRVEFFNGTTKLGEDLSSPYSYAWNNVAEGSYTITAVATDNSDNKTTSTAISIVVGNPRIPLIPNGEFDQGTTGWDIQNNSGAAGTINVVTNGNLSGTNSLRICPATPGTANWHVQVRHTVPLITGKNYRISFMAKADAARTMTVSLQQDADPYTTYFEQQADLSTANQTFTFEYNSTVSDANAKLKFYVGGNATCVLIDKVELSEGNFQVSSTITPAGLTTFCSGGSVLLNANTGIGYTYQWKRDDTDINAATSASYTATQSGSYTVVVTASSQSATSTAVLVTANAAPGAPTVTSPVSYCQNATATALTATGTSLKWYTVSSGGTALVTAPTPSTTATGTTNYYVSQSTNECESPRALIAVTIHAAPGAPTVTTPVSYCQNATATILTATGTSIKWYTASSGGTASSIAPTPYTTTLGTTNYYVSQTTDECESPRALIAVTIHAAPGAPTVTTPVSYCQNATATILTATGTSIKWYTEASGGTELTSSPTPSTSASGTTNYYVSQTSNGCESDRALISVTVNAIPSAPTVTSPVTYCENATATDLTANDTSLKWYTASSGGTALASTPTPLTTSIGTTNYYVSQTSNGCESDRALISVTVNALPSAPTVTTPVTYCQNASAIALTATGTALQWYTASTGGAGSATAPIPSTSIIGTVTYYVSQTTNGCESARAEIIVNTNSAAAATITAGGSTTFCQGGSVTLTANTGSSYSWMKGTTQVGTDATYTTNTSGNYTVQITNPSGCAGQVTSSATIVTVNAIPSAPTVTSPVSYCQNASAITLTATGTALQWYTASTGGIGSSTAPIPSTTTIGTATYYVSQTTNECESARAVITVNTNSAATATITAGGSTTFCEGGSVTLTANTGSSYSWMNGTTQVGTNATYTANASGNYTVQITNPSGCTGQVTSSATVVTVNAIPSAPAVISPVSYCQNATATALTATGTSLKWYAASSGGTASATASIPSTTTIGTTNYYVSQTTNDCESPRALIVVTINSAPAIPTISPDGPTTFVEGGSVTLHTNTEAGLTYQWLNGDLEVGTGASYTATGTGSYRVEARNASGCKAISSITSVTVNGNQATVITINSPTPNSTTTGNTITFDISAQDPDGSITRVDYYANGTLVGSSTTAPYVFEWNNPGEGTHDLYVKVTDSNGEITTSDTVTVRMDTATGIVSGGYNLFTGIVPNPSVESFRITSSRAIKSMRITNMYGREMETWNDVEADKTTEIGRELSEGTYLVVIEYASGAMEVAKLIKLK